MLFCVNLGGSFLIISPPGKLFGGLPLSILEHSPFAVLWRLEKGDFRYAKFNITEVEYNNPEKY